MSKVVKEAIKVCYDEKFYGDMFMECYKLKTEDEIKNV